MTYHNALGPHPLNGIRDVESAHVEEKPKIGSAPFRADLIGDGAVTGMIKLPVAHADFKGRREIKQICIVIDKSSEAAAGTVAKGPAASTRPSWVADS